MISLILKLDGDNVGWDDLMKRKLLYSDKPIELTSLADGMSSGRPSVCMRIDLKDNQTVLVETSARLFCGAAKALMARYPKLFEED